MIRFSFSHEVMLFLILLKVIRGIASDFIKLVQPRLHI